jgi:hypothetical protein
MKSSQLKRKLSHYISKLISIFHVKRRHLRMIPYLKLMYGWVQRFWTISWMLRGHGWTCFKGRSIRHTKYKREAQSKEWKQEWKSAHGHVRHHFFYHFVSLTKESCVRDDLLFVTKKKELKWAEKRTYSISLLFSISNQHFFIFTTPLSLSHTLSLSLSHTHKYLVKAPVILYRQCPILLATSKTWLLDIYFVAIPIFL